RSWRGTPRAWTEGPARRPAATSAPTTPIRNPTATQTHGVLTGQSCLRSKPTPLIWYDRLMIQKRKPPTAAPNTPDPTTPAWRPISRISVSVGTLTRLLRHSGLATLARPALPRQARPGRTGDRDTPPRSRSR